MLKQLKIVFWLIATVLVIQGCKDLYEPNINPSEKVLVVEGVVTNLPGPYYVKLTTAVKYNANETIEPNQGAQVVVNDDQGGVFTYTEILPGQYQSPPEMAGIVGHKYTLHIITTDGVTYGSYPQEIMPPHTIESLKAKRYIKTESVETEFGNIVVVETPGINAILSVNETSTINPKIRFQSEIMVQYNREITEFKNQPHNDPPDPPAIPMWYCWKVFAKAEGTNNINAPATSNEPGDVNNNVVAFIPNRVNRFYLMASDEYLMHLLLRVKLYSLNDDSYKYHFDIYKQLSSDGSLFAPIASQIFSNIFCESNPNTPAIGMFEASSAYTEGFVVTEIFSADTVYFVPTDKFNNPPAAGCLNNIKPPFWVE
jgi:hypothetical protein